MMRNTMIAIGVAALAAVAHPGQSAAQTSEAPQPIGTPAPQQTAAAPAQSRLQVVTSQIAAVQKRALADPELQAANRAIGELITATASRLDPGYLGYSQRAVALKTEVDSAQAAQDNDKLWALADEAKQLQAKISAAQERARSDAEVTKKLDEFKVQLFAKMVQLDPKVQELVKELETLQSTGAPSGGN
jgi:hypothetical protein